MMAEWHVKIKSASGVMQPTDPEKMPCFHTALPVRTLSLELPVIDPIGRVALIIAAERVLSIHR